MKNNFRFDTSFFCTWGEKQATKYIELEPGADGTRYHLQVTIDYTEETKCFTRQDLHITIHMQKWETKPGAACSHSYGIGKRKVLSSGHNKKMFNKIIRETENWTNEKCIELFESMPNQYAPGEAIGYY